MSDFVPLYAYYCHQKKPFLIIHKFTQETYLTPYGYGLIFEVKESTIKKRLRDNTLTLNVEIASGHYVVVIPPEEILNWLDDDFPRVEMPGLNRDRGSARILTIGFFVKQLSTIFLDKDEAINLIKSEHEKNKKFQQICRTTIMVRHKIRLAAKEKLKQETAATKKLKVNSEKLKKENNAKPICRKFASQSNRTPESKTKPSQKWDGHGHLKPGSIYLVQNTVTSNVKIGFSTNTKQRLKALQASSDCPLVILKTRAGTMSEELELHNRFSQYRLNGEWFIFSDEIAVFFGVSWNKKTLRKAKDSGQLSLF